MIQILFWLALGLIVYTYIVYPILITIIALIWRRKHAVQRNCLSVSLVVSMYNECKVVADKISNSLALDYPNEKIEILLGSDGSTDETNNIVKQYVDSRIKFYEFPARRGKISVLNDLIACASGEIIIFSDANTILSRDAVWELVSWFSEPSVGCVCGKLELKAAEGGHNAEFEGFYWKYESFIKEQEGKLGCLLGANGGIYAIRKKLFSSLPAETILDDFLIPMEILQAGFLVLYNPRACAYEDTAKSISQESIRKVRIGAGNFQALFWLYRLLDVRKGLSSFIFLSHKVFRWCVPFLLIIVFFFNLPMANFPVYNVIFVFQIVFYFFVFLGFLVNRYKLETMKFFVSFYYFFSMNLSLLKGFLNFVRVKNLVLWEKVQR